MSTIYIASELTLQGIVVKVVAQKLGDRHYKKKGVVREVISLYTGIVQLLDSKDKLKIDQAHLETVIPAIGEVVVFFFSFFSFQF